MKEPMKPEFSQETPVQFLKSVGPARARALTRLGIGTVGDLLAHYPRRYFDRSSTVPIRSLGAGQDVTVRGEILTASERRVCGWYLWNGVICHLIMDGLAGGGWANKLMQVNGAQQDRGNRAKGSRRPRKMLAMCV